MKLSIIGTVGIPAKYGGFETLTEHLTSLLNKKINITVYCSSPSYNQKQKKYNNSSLIYIPLLANGIQSIPYDIISLFHAARKHDTVLMLGVSGCIALPLFRLFYPRKRLIINIDGLEHQRDKWKKGIRKFLKYSEKLAVKYADNVITDNAAIQKYVTKTYNINSTLIAYGGDHSSAVPLSNSVKKAFSIPETYAFKVCRIEPENNIHLILDAFSKLKLPLVIIGNWDNSKYGENLKEQYSKYDHLQLLSPIYDQHILNQIRANCKVYIHGHSAGGTNPSLVEAMNLGLPIFGFDVDYNRETTLNEAKFFIDAQELQSLIQNTSDKSLETMKETMKILGKKYYTWEKIAEQYYKLL